ncbi:MAG: hypothetical protein LLF98_10460 [Clostridium sp.]|uniref:hypothetical protein n=1 Tax=Clostridium sp. TaxID=1506 RepID=UPI0025B94F5D|nr:hypothetical protein [Clostridium sp.]MCE5221660.1 hypothetical protein [Clostridium sp.]
MKKKETCKEKCRFTVHPCNFKVKIKEVKPFCVRACKSIVLDLQIINHCNANSCIKIKSRPMYGKLYLLGPSTLIYKSTRRFCGLDLFQIIIEDEFGEMRTESILIHAI